MVWTCSIKLRLLTSLNVGRQHSWETTNLNNNQVLHNVEADQILRIIEEVVFCERPAATRPVLGPSLPPNDRC